MYMVVKEHLLLVHHIVLEGLEQIHKVFQSSIRSVCTINHYGGFYCREHEVDGILFKVLQ